MAAVIHKNKRNAATNNEKVVHACYKAWALYDTVSILPCVVHTTKTKVFVVKASFGHITIQVNTWISTRQIAEISSRT